MVEGGREIEEGRMGKEWGRWVRRGRGIGEGMERGVGGIGG